MGDWCLSRLSAALLLWHAGNDACRRALKEAKYVSDALETMSTTLEGSIVLNTSTHYLTGSSKAPAVVKGIELRKAELECCTACSLAGLSTCVPRAKRGQVVAVKLADPLDATAST